MILCLLNSVHRTSHFCFPKCNASYDFVIPWCTYSTCKIKNTFELGVLTFLFWFSYYVLIKLDNWSWTGRNSVGYSRQENSLALSMGTFVNLWCIKWPQIDGNVFLTGKVYELSLELKAELVSGFKPLRINSFGASSSGAFAPALSGAGASGRWVYGP